MSPGGTQWFQCLKACLAVQIQQFLAKRRKMFPGGGGFCLAGPVLGQNLLQCRLLSAYAGFYRLRAPLTSDRDWARGAKPVIRADGSEVWEVEGLVERGVTSFGEIMGARPASDAFLARNGVPPGGGVVKKNSVAPLPCYLPFKFIAAPTWGQSPSHAPRFGSNI